MEINKLIVTGRLNCRDERKKNFNIFICLQAIFQIGLSCYLAAYISKKDDMYINIKLHINDYEFNRISNPFKIYKVFHYKIQLFSPMTFYQPCLINYIICQQILENPKTFNRNIFRTYLILGNNQQFLYITATMYNLPHDSSKEYIRNLHAAMYY